MPRLRFENRYPPPPLVKGPARPRADGGHVPAIANVVVDEDVVEAYHPHLFVEGTVPPLGDDDIAQLRADARSRRAGVIAGEDVYDHCGLKR